MGLREMEGTERRNVADILSSHWLLFILVGVLLIVGGGVAITVPVISAIAPNELLGLVLMFVGIVQLAQSGKMLGAPVFAWYLVLGLLAAIGGVFVYLDPFANVVPVMVLMALVFALHGLTQIIFAAKVRQMKGWHWFLVSACIAFLVAGLLLIKLPYGHTFTPATIGGVSLIFAGWAYVAVAMAARNAARGFSAN